MANCSGSIFSPSVFTILMASRRARAAAKKGEPVPATQIEGYAFNVYGWALEIPADEPAFAGTVIINAYEPCGTPWETGVASMIKKGEDPWRKSLALTARELDDSEGAGGIQRYLLVGITSADLEVEHLKMHNSQTKQKPVGTHLAADSIIEISNKERLPIMVVTQIQETEQPKTDLFVLLRPRLGLCTPFHVGQKECFYLPVFRENTTSLSKRGPAWNQLVAKQALRPSERELSVKQMAYKKARNTSKVVLEPKVALQNEIMFLVECFSKTGEMWHLQELVSVLEQADEDLTFIPPASNMTMRKFVDNEEEFEQEDPARMIEELGQTWPDLVEIDAIDLSMLKEELVRADIILEYQLIRPFLSEALFQLRKRREAGLGLLDVAEEAIATVRRVLANCESAVPILTQDDESSLFTSILAALKNILKAASAFDKGLKDNSGDQTATGTLHDIWEKYADSLDTDSAKLAWFQAARYLTAAQKHKQRGLGEMVEDIVEVLEQMKLDSKMN
jgi:hypothetical protein